MIVLHVTVQHHLTLGNVVTMLTLDVVMLLLHVQVEIALEIADVVTLVTHKGWLGLALVNHIHVSL